MIRKFVIATEALTQQQERELGSFLSEYGTWWHWLSNIWLLRTEKDGITTNTIRSKIESLNEVSDIMILEINGVKSYSGMAPKSSAEQSRSWISKYFFDRDET
jgi:hypothetical protein